MAGYEQSLDRDGDRRERQGWMSRAVSAVQDALEAESERWFVWLPVLFSCGILLYFSLPTEPDARVALALPLIALAIAVGARRATFGLVLGGALLALAAGFATAKIRTNSVSATVLEKELRFTELRGWIEALEGREGNRKRLTLRAIALGDLAPSAVPYRVRVTASSKAAAGLRTGDAVSLKATLQPPPEPVQPGAFDFGRTAWYDSLGGIGYATSRIERFTPSVSPPWTIWAWAQIDAVRDQVNERVRRALPGQTGEISVALITGERGGIPERVNQAMRDSGLAHILSISGLHMAIMAGTVFWLVRAALALFPSIALRYPIRKWAAATAILAALLYLGLSGAAVPTVRSWIMTSLVLLAVLLDRPALTMRNVALAALAILIVAPESLFDASFQMSFAAVVALIALYEWLGQRERSPISDVSLFWRTLRMGGLLFWGAALTTIIASFAVAPFALYHFHRVTHFGLLANLIATPLVTLLVMPMALLSLVAMPFGLEAWPLKAMGVGVDLMVATGEWVAGLPGAVTVLPAVSGNGLALVVLGCLWLCLGRTKLRAFGLVFILLGFVLAPAVSRPDILVEANGEALALRGADGTLMLAPASTGKYSVEKWLLADGDAREASTVGPGSFRCDPLGCIGTVKGKTVALIRHPAALADDCRRADIVIVLFTVGERCRAAIVLDRRRLKSGGAHALYVEEFSVRTETVAAARGMRPWVPARPASQRYTPEVGSAYAKGEGTDGAAEQPPARNQ